MRSLLSSLFGVLAAAALAAPGAFAADLPPIKAAPSNAVPECATPGRLMAFLASRNKRLDPRYSSVATEYMRHGETLGLRWDIAFFQMLVETGNLTYTGDVKPRQNNFAGLGATGGGVSGESFADISSGVLAHLQHVSIYAGDRIENPVAERTRKLQEWDVMKDWYKDVKGPKTFSHLARQWAPGSNGYPRDIAAIASAFMTGACRAPDPQPELVQEARGESAARTPPATATAAAEPPAAPKTEAARSVDEPAPPAAANMAPEAAALMEPEPSKEAPKAAEAALEEPKGEPKAEAVKEAASGGAPRAESGAATRMASAQQAAASPPAAAPGSSCRVWTASYGGNKAIIIKATLDKTVNYTVLDVNEGKERREAEAYIAAYAKGGETVGEFASQTQALDRAFELCPEGSPPQ